MLTDDPAVAAALAAVASSSPPLAPPERWQPMHVVYAGASRFSADVRTKLGTIAKRALDEHGSDPFVLADVLALPGSRPTDPRARDDARQRFARDPQSVDEPTRLALTVHARIEHKLAHDAVEDFRIDFEDGYGPHPDDEEDADARRAATELARGLAQGTLPRAIGIRIRALEGPTTLRALRTLELFVTEAHALAGRLPDPFVVTLPKVETESSLRLLAHALGALEIRLALRPGSLVIEAMLETPRALLDAHGTCPLPRWPDAAAGRLSAVHLGAYDLSASIDVPAPHQTLHHPVCVEALLRAKLALTGRGVHVADGATTQLPLAPKHASPEETRAAVHAGWRVHAQHVREAIALGVFQGWDLHPAQIVARLGALYGFFLAALPDATVRLASFRAAEERATRVGATFDDAATGRGLRGFFERGAACGALGPDDVARAGSR